MAKLESLGIKALEAVHWYVHDLERSRRFYVEALDFQEIGRSAPEVEARSRQSSRVFRADGVVLLVSAPMGEGSRAWRYLRKHPDGVGTLIFEVEDAQQTFKLLDQRGGTFVTDIERFEDGKGGKLATFSITTPFGDTTFRFVQREGYRDLFPGMQSYELPRGGDNRFGIRHIDHVTSNFRTLKPALLWMEQVMGFERFWDIEFHTDDVARDEDKGSGLRSVVMWDPRSGVKFANNEPLRPHFKQSQINLFVEDHHGEGVQHLALAVRDILSAVREMRAQPGLEFMPTSGAYYDALPERILRMGIKQIDEEVDALRELQILVDGDKERSYLLQIFMKDAASLYRDPQAGPFFYELIQRKGDQGFGGGNFRALFESIERQQKSEGRG